jgi:S-DNA-T family DNA segregation ATPase FtsK/SpoIIIE
LKWWKKFLSRFFSDHEINEHDHDDVIHKKINKRQEQAEMKTKVVYQYPKGEFRFPLIEDPPKKRMEHNGQHPRRPVPKRPADNIAETNAQTPGRRKQGTVEPKSTRPFEPTPIPSPVYGFHRPEKRGPSIPEFELADSFFRRLGDQQTDAHASCEAMKQEDPVRFGAKAPNIHTYEPPNENQAEVRPGPTGQGAFEHDESAASLDQAADGDYEISPFFPETETAGPSAPDEASDEPQAQEQPAFKNADEQKAAVDGDASEPLRDDHVAGIAGKDENKAENLLSTGEHPKRPAHAERDKKAGPRSHLPFNVLMLKQDKINWERQKRKREKQSGLSGKTETAESKHQENETTSYVFPAVELLQPPVEKINDHDWLNEQSALLDKTLENFNVRARVVRASQGPSVTRFEVQPDPGVKVNKITNLSNDIKLSMAAKDIRMEAPIPGTRSIGIELPNHKSRPVRISEIIGSGAFRHSASPLTAALGLDISGNPVVTDLRKMPHGLIAGATGSGKSVCINSILVSLLYKAGPDQLKLLLIDPKMVELAPYNHIPHLVSPVITDVKAAAAALKWAVDEMERRYGLFVHANVRDIARFNDLVEKNGQFSEKLPYIVIIIDELADLMMAAPAEVEESICRIAQKARACGIHLLIATQRPSVDVITGLIKANVPTRIAFSVSSQVDSRTVIDMSGAEKLLGRGDMLFLNNGSVKPVRLQGTFVSDEEIDRIIHHVRSQGEPDYLFQQEELLKKAEFQENEDELFVEACEFVVSQGHASTSLLQRQFRIGYNRAARLMEMMEEQGVISGSRGSRPRDVLISEEDLHSIKDSLVQ